MGTFVFRWPHPANDVHVTGTFDDWGKTEKLEKVGDVFEKEVTLPSADEKYYYKFVVDDLWTTDHEAPQEDDGHHNVNNILMPEQIKRTTSSTADQTSSGPTGTSETPSGTNEHSVAGMTGLAAAGGAGAAMLSSVTPQSTTAGLAGEVPKEGGNAAEDDGDKLGGDEFSGDKRAETVPSETEQTHSPPGAFPEEPADEPQDFAAKPIPASEGMGNPVSVPAGEKVPEPSTINSNTISSTATTSKEGYEKDASAAFPVAAAAAGVGIAGAAGAAAYAHEQKPEAESFGVNPIPASSGIGNPISVPAGEKLPEQSSFNPNTVQSTATTSKEGYERDASAPAVAMASGTGTGAATDSAFSLPEKSKNMIPESSLPMGDEAKNTTDTGPFISSAAPKSSSYWMAATVPFEEKRQGRVIDEDEAPSATLSGPAPTIPEMVKESMAEAHQSPEAAGSPEAVEEKAVMEDELLKKVKTTDAAGEHAPSPAAEGTTSVPVGSVASNVPATVAESIAQAHQPAEAAAAQEVVDEKRDMESELLSKVKSTDATGEHAPSLTAEGASTVPVSSVASNVPETVKESIAQAHQPAEAAGAQEIVNEKRDMESELLSKVKSTDAAGEPAPTVSAATTETAPQATDAGTTTLISPTAPSDAPTHAAPFEGVTPGVEEFHPAPHASNSKPQSPEPPLATIPDTKEEDTSAPADPATATATGNTPTKAIPESVPTTTTTTTPSTTAASPASTATKDQKKKNRRSFFGKLKDKLKDL